MVYTDNSHFVEPTSFRRRFMLCSVRDDEAVQLKTVVTLHGKQFRIKRQWCGRQRFNFLSRMFLWCIPVLGLYLFIHSLIRFTNGNTDDVSIIGFIIGIIVILSLISCIVGFGTYTTEEPLNVAIEKYMNKRHCIWWTLAEKTDIPIEVVDIIVKYSKQRKMRRHRRFELV